METRGLRLKLCAADVTRNSFYCLDNQSVDELVCHSPFVETVLQKEQCEEVLCWRLWRNTVLKSGGSL